jgi:hypothetical protein
LMTENPLLVYPSTGRINTSCKLCSNGAGC